MALICPVKPAAELKLAPHREAEPIRPEKLTPLFRESLFGDSSGDCLEFEAQLSFDEPAICELTVRATPDGAEYTTISCHSARRIADRRRKQIQPRSRR